ncbi:MAG: hypothetical protein R3F34_06860 [Planctomycetota bacterium]
MSFLVLDRDAERSTGRHGDAVDARVLGRPRWEKGRARIDLCTPDGVLEADVLRRTSVAMHKALKAPELATQTYRVELEGTRVSKVLEQPDA